MTRIAAELCRILDREKHIYTRIADIEQEKSGAIMAKEGKRLLSLSEEQERLLAGIQELERERLELIASDARRHGWGNDPRNVTLSAITGLTDGTDRDELARAGAALKEEMARVQALTDTNAKMIDDIMDFYQHLVADLKRRVSLKTGYNRRAVEETSIDNPLIFSRRA